MKNKKDPFEYYIKPKNGWEVIRWASFDSLRYYRYHDGQNLSFWGERMLFLKLYFFYLIPKVLQQTVLIWLACLLIVTLLDFPSNTPENIWNALFLLNWHEKHDFATKYFFLISYNLINLTLGLVIGLVIGLVLGLVSGLTIGLPLSIFLSIFIGSTFGLVGGLVDGLTVGIYMGILVGLFMGTAMGLIRGFVTILFMYVISYLGEYMNVGTSPILDEYLALLLKEYWTEGLHIPLFGIRIRYWGVGFGGVLAVGSVWLYYSLRSRFVLLNNNIYLEKNTIDLSLFCENRLLDQAKQQPEMALRFTSFLFKNRRDNNNLAALLSHAAQAQLQKEAALHLNEVDLILPDLKVNGFSIPDNWFKQLESVKIALVAAEQESQISIKKELFQDFVHELEILHQLTLNPYPKPTGLWERLSMTRRIDWYEFYRDAYLEWLRIARQELERIQARAQEMEPSAPNIFKTGDKLTRHDSAVFITRTDLKDQLSRVLHTTKGFSVIFLQGQRRVGKTSLLTFLPDILGRRFKVVYQDLQGNTADVPDFLKKLRQAINDTFGIKEKEIWAPPENWTKGLHLLYEYCAGIATENQVRIILALDEYEELHRHLQKDEEQGRDFLGAFRHLSQKQVEISVMWVGLKFFSELQHPNWADYFVNAIPIQVPYLNREESEKLIAVTTLDFLPGVKEAIFEDTQGHPALIQKICFGIVDIANAEERRTISMEDYQQALKKMIYITNNGVTDIFYNTTCETTEDKAIVWAVIEKNPVPKAYQHRLRRLMEYGFVIEDNGQYRLCAPIFKKWVEDFAEYHSL